MQPLLTLTFTILSYVAVAVFVVGLIYKTYQLKTTPVPLKIPTTPQSPELSGVAARMAGDVVFFRSLFKGETERGLWTAGWLFHVGFFLVVLRHIRYFVYPVPTWVVWMTHIGVAMGLVMFVALLALYIRRYTNERVKYITTYADLFILGLIILIVGSGLVMKFSARPDVTGVKAFIMGILTFSPTAVPTDSMFLFHLTMVLILLAYFPFSKLMHSVGYFLSPTRNQVNNPRKVRHVNPWADEAWQKMVNGPRPIDAQTDEPYQPWSQAQWRKRWLKEE
ncbi:MAG: nitrate reductase [Nitrospirales bacterium]|nr:nitrate reductase [Nitrospirales bacterium]